MIILATEPLNLHYSPTFPLLFLLTKSTENTCNQSKSHAPFLPLPSKQLRQNSGVKKKWFDIWSQKTWIYVHPWKPYFFVSGGLKIPLLSHRIVMRPQQEHSENCASNSTQQYSPKLPGLRWYHSVSSLHFQETRFPHSPNSHLPVNQQHMFTRCLAKVNL